MFDFPSSPAVGQVANGYTWNGTGWTNGPGLQGPVTEQFFDISGVASPPGYIVQVPSWAKACQIELHVFVGAGASNNLHMRYSVDGTTFIAGAADYAVGGPHHLALSGTPFGTFAATTYHSVYLAFANDPNVTSPHQVSGTIALTRPDTSKQLGNVRMQSRNWDNNASAGLRTNWMTGYLVPASPGSALAIKALQFFSALGNAFGNGSWLKVQWIGDSAQIPQSNAIGDAPADGCEYVRVNGIWRLKSQSVILDGLMQADAAVPAGARLLKIRGDIIQATTAATSMCMRVSLDGTTFFANANDYNHSGFIHYGTAAPTTVSTLSGAYSFMYLAYNSTAQNSMNFVATLNLNRDRVAGFRWNLNAVASSYGASGWASNVSRVQIMETNTGTALSIKAVRFLQATAIAFGGSSTIDLEWVY